MMHCEQGTQTTVTNKIMRARPEVGCFLLRFRPSFLVYVKCEVDARTVRAAKIERNLAGDFGVLLF